MTRKEQRRGYGLRAALLGDPLRKVAAIALGYLLWLFIDSQINATHDFDLPILVSYGEKADGGDRAAPRLLVPIPTANVAVVKITGSDGREHDSVRVTAHGPRFLVDSLRSSPLQLSVGDLASDWDKTDSIEFAVADLLTVAHTSRGVTLTMEPARIRLHLERMRWRDEDLRIERVELAGDERLRARLRRHLAEFSQPRARIVGPAKDLAALRPDTGTPFQAMLEARDNDRSVTAALTLTQGADRLHLHEPVTVTIPLLPVRQEFAVTLLLLIDDLALPPALRGAYRAEEASRTVRIKVSGELLTTLVTLADAERQAWVDQHLRLHVWVPRREDERSLGAEIVVAARLQLVGPLADRIDPVDYVLAETVTVTLRRQP
ncbi:MAG: hypothetical protein IPK26_24455 [Planctomycetes bacterium]|nr:hypothetical protein [Planctomycetota bacterium]